MRFRELRRGDHIKVRRPRGYEHHAIYIGEGWVVHYAHVGRGQMLRIAYGTLDDFAQGGLIEIVEYEVSYLPEFVVQRAESRIGVTNYSLPFNNCEHFARWCIVGHSASVQVDRIVATTFGSVATPTASRLVIGSLMAKSAAEGLAGGSAVMRGLKLAGGLVRGGAGAGLVVVTSAPIMAANLAMQKFLRDDPFAPRTERHARLLGRSATLVASGLGLGAALWAVSAVGLPGLSAVGISSGLAAIGSTIGGGMLSGLGLVAIGPALLACGLGYLFYKLFRPTRQLSATPAY